MNQHFTTFLTQPLSSLLFLGISFLIVASKGFLHAVLWSVLFVLGISYLLLANGLELVPLLIVLIFMSGIAILFVFTNFLTSSSQVHTERKKSLTWVLPIFYTVLLSIAGGFSFIFVAFGLKPLSMVFSSIPTWVSLILSSSVYGPYSYFFVTVTLVLLIALIGALWVTKENKPEGWFQALMRWIKEYTDLAEEADRLGKEQTSVKVLKAVFWVLVVIVIWWKTREK